MEVKFLEICDLGVKVGSWELKSAEMGVLQTARRAWKGGLQGLHIPVPHFQWVAPPPPPPSDHDHFAKLYNDAFDSIFHIPPSANNFKHPCPVGPAGSCTREASFLEDLVLNVSKGFFFKKRLSGCLILANFARFILFFVKVFILYCLCHVNWIYFQMGKAWNNF